jgi:hypothetical protein
MIMFAVLFLAAVAAGRGDESGSIAMSKELAAFQKPKENWSTCGNVRRDPKNRRKLAIEEGKGVLVSDGRGVDLRTKKSYRDCQVEVDFMIPQGSNSGVKLNGCYEIQIYDSWKKDRVTGSDCGGIYPRGEYLPFYHTIDDGTPPKVNACREPGQWQTLKIKFHSPRFDAKGKKIASARFDRVELNGILIQENAEVKYPTGAAWHNPENSEGPVLLQGDHGPVAFRNLRIKPL